ncbi:dendritic cell-specific transmembrane protein [Rhinatrema bivittatum]|uniref:dendritic cell-specific transmembrane protein n=1 Tax=Rhinatrema bivittatum TaxID=194408 RepID=UPI0011267450|nr:dendritic cell-specific transmembrane protein [Rhinatrema bivittatum]
MVALHQADCRSDGDPSLLVHLQWGLPCPALVHTSRLFAQKPTYLDDVGCLLSQVSVMIDFAKVTQVCLHVVDIFVSKRKAGWKNTLDLLVVCCTLGLISGATLFLALHLSNTCTGLVSSLVSAFTTIAISSLLFSSKHVRCFSVLFLLSCGMSEGRNALITAGTGIVIFHDVKNIFNNLRNLADSITCNLEAKRLSLQVTPLDQYIKTIRWIYDQGALFNPFPDIVTLKDSIDVHTSLLDEGVKMKLNETKLQIERVVGGLSTLLDATFFVGRWLLFVLGLAMVFIGTVVFLRRYLSKDSVKFDNAYITKAFVKFDERRRKEGKTCVLPLNKKERKEYSPIPTLRLSLRERKHVGLFFLPILMNLGIWTLFTAIDFLVYWLISSVSKHLKDLPEQTIPWLISNFREGKVLGIVPEKSSKNSFSASFNIALFECECIPTPQVSLSKAWIPLGVITVLLLVLGMLSAVLTQLKLMVTASFYPSKELERIRYLHSKVLKKRSKAASNNAKRKLSGMVTKLHFWFPVLKMNQAAAEEMDIML